MRAADRPPISCRWIDSPRILIDRPITGQTRRSIVVTFVSAHEIIFASRVCTLTTISSLAIQLNIYMPSSANLNMPSTDIIGRKSFYRSRPIAIPQNSRNELFSLFHSLSCSLIYFTFVTFIFVSIINSDLPFTFA